jgi:DHA1 family multidrug resistance protein-like MFS transporter
MVSILAAGLLYLPQSMVTAGWQLLVLQALTGVAVGGIIPSISALLANYSQPGHEGAVYGLDNSINAAGRAVAPLLGGAIAAWFSLRATFTSTAVILFIAFIMANTLIPKIPVSIERKEDGG